MTASNVSVMRTPASLGTSLREQIRLLGATRRWLYPIALLSAFTMLTYGPQDAAVAITGVMLAFLAAVWPMIVWYGETPARRTYHWSLPVPRAAHDLMRVASGAFYLAIISMSVSGVAMLLDGGPPPAPWTVTAIMLLLVPLAVYFLMTALALWSDYSITRWALALFVGVTFSSVILERLGLAGATGWLRAAFFDENWGIAFMLLEGVFQIADGRTLSSDQWPRAVILWLGIGLALCFLAASFRPDEIKRRLRTARPV